ncbi:maleylpyruvate isomerase family mycothiol-dependent enzyme [Nonomuraea sp. NPDC050310]|uniref:maleylpyruvate isomerase family mycothiol-dependent enzyme n=1 Tax=unclassified Nonomuraea TaxID=2593643 RepID=UPI00340D5537
MTGGLALLERAISYTLGSLVLVTPEAFGRATPCRGWRLVDLLVHMDDSLAALSEAAGLGEIALEPRPVHRGRHRAPEPPADQLPQGAGEPWDNGWVPDPVANIRLRACRLLGEWAYAGEEGTVTVGGCPLTAMTVAAVGAIEIAVHGWDVARACGTDRPLPEGLAGELLDLAPVLIDDEDRPLRFGAKVEVSVGAGKSEELLAYLGRRSRLP